MFDSLHERDHNPYNDVQQERSMEVTLKKMGNSTALVIPPPVLKDLGISAGQRLTLNTTADGKILLTPKRKYVLADLIAQCDLTAAPPADLALWDVARPVGGEVL
jgi:antitoxin ChpS